MIKCRLAILLAERKLKVSELARETGINKNTLHRMYNETVTRVDLDAIEKICRYLDIEVGELFCISENG